MCFLDFQTLASFLFLPDIPLPGNTVSLQEGFRNFRSDFFGDILFGFLFLWHIIHYNVPGLVFGPTVPMSFLLGIPEESRTYLRP